MPGKGIRNAVYKRAGGKGQSSRFYNIYGKVVKPTDPTGFKGGQGWTAPKPQIGSMLSLGIMKQNRNAGGNNVCQPGPKPKNAECVPLQLTANNIMTVAIGFSGINLYGYGAPGQTYLPFGSLSPISVPGSAATTPNTVVQIMWVPGAQFFEIIVDYSAAAAPAAVDTDFKTISFINCDNKSTLTFSTEASQPAAIAAGPSYDISTITDIQWRWESIAPGTAQFETINAFWTSAVGKNIKVVFDSTVWGPDLTSNYCCDNNNDCKCRGPLAQCPCRKGGC